MNLELFLSICEKYGVEMRKGTGGMLMKEPGGGTHLITDADIDRVFGFLKGWPKHEDSSSC